MNYNKTGDGIKHPERMKNRMTIEAQKTALQNAAKYAGGAITIHECNNLDKRKTVPKFFAQIGQETISPVLDYAGLNYFLHGYGKAKQAQTRGAAVTTSGKHTPGPWTAARMFNPPTAKDRTCGFVVNGPETGEPLPARICDLRVPPGVGSFSEYKANANLIAAAPELLAALESLYAHEGERELSGIGTSHDSEALEIAKTAAQAAIAKAKGGAL